MCLRISCAGFKRHNTRNKNEKREKGITFIDHSSIHPRFVSESVSHPFWKSRPSDDDKRIVRQIHQIDQMA